MQLYHNLIQNKAVENASWLADDIEQDGFADGLEERVWFAPRPLGDGIGGFVGLAVTVPAGLDLEQYHEIGDGIELELGVPVYAIPASIVNQWPRQRWYPREGELIE